MFNMFFESHDKNTTVKINFIAYTKDNNNKKN